MTLKDQFDVIGHDTTLGYVGRSFQPAASSASLVQILESLGAVFLAKTNLPQSIMWCETENPLFGLTTHPRNPKLTPGGSSGGEGVMLAEKASVVGWGTDIGGSVRIPAHMNGLYALKPSVGCLSWNASFVRQTDLSNRVADFPMKAVKSPPPVRNMYLLSSVRWQDH
jgi:Asp-tRNA(Asn)/Glu-tRNA(Gln) amidotransferase A subunit family amidase